MNAWIARNRDDLLAWLLLVLVALAVVAGGGCYSKSISISTERDYGVYTETWTKRYLLPPPDFEDAEALLDNGGSVTAPVPQPKPQVPDVLTDPPDRGNA